MQIELDKIIRDRDCQPRLGIDLALVNDYAQEMVTGATFPPVTVFRDEAGYYLADGFHRLDAARTVGRDTIEAEVYDGGKRAAMLYAAGANATHGLRRTNADKRRAVEVLLHDEEWSQWSDREIARRCGVSHPFVSQIRASLVTVTSEPATERTYTDRHGNVSTMNTANIGARPAPEPAPSHTYRAPDIAAQLAAATDEDEDTAGDDDEIAPATPAECQFVLNALEALFTALERPGDEEYDRVPLDDVVAYVRDHYGAETRNDFARNMEKLIDDTMFLRYELAQMRAAALAS